MTSTFLVYKIINRVNDKAYIGVTTCSLAKRWREHVCAARKMQHALARAMRRYGVANFSMALLYEASSDAEMRTVERGLICAHATLKPNGYNIALGGEGATGVSRPGASSHSAIITEEVVRFLRDPANGAITNGEMVAVIRDRFGLAVSRDCLRDARRGTSWRNLDATCPPIKVGQGGRMTERRRSASRASLGLAHVRAASAAASSLRMRGTRVAAKLTAAQVRVIRADMRPHSAIAADYGVDRSTITLVKANKVWLDA